MQIPEAGETLARGSVAIGLAMGESTHHDAIGRCEIQLRGLA